MRCAGPALARRWPISLLGFAIAASACLVTALAVCGLRPAWVVGHPRTVLLAALGVSLAAAVAVVDLSPPRLALSIDPSTEPMLPRHDPAREAYRESVRDFGEDEVYVVAMQVDDVFREDALRRLRRVGDRIAGLPEIRQVQSLADVISFRWVPAGVDGLPESDAWRDPAPPEAPDGSIEVGRFLDEIPSDPAALAELRARALADPLYRRNLISDDGRTAALNVSFRELGDRELIDSRLDARIGAILAEETAPGVRFHVAGRPHIKDRVYRLMLRDLRVLLPLALAVVGVLLWAVFGTRRGVVLPAANVLTATLWAFGAMAFLGRPLSILTSLLGPMLIAIGSVYGVHALARWEEDAAGVRDAREAALRSLEHLRLPTLISGLTTVIGFGALLVSDVPAVIELGAFAALGVACVTLLTLSALPAALALLPLRPDALRRRARAERLAHRLDVALARLGAWSARHADRVILAAAGVVAACALALPRIAIDTDWLSYFDEDSDLRRDFEAVDRLLAGATPLYVTLRGPEPGTFRNPEALRALERLQRAAETLPGVSRTLSMTDTVRVMNRVLAGDDPAEERIPDERGAVAELVFLAPKGHLDRYSSADHGRANVWVRTGAVGSAALRELERGLEGALAAAGLPPGIEARITGNAILLARSADGIAGGQASSVGLASAAIFLLVAAGLRSAGLGAVAMLPNLLPVLVFFGLLGFGVAPLSLATSLIGSVALGIAVDDTVHFLVRYRREREAGRDPLQAVVLCCRRVGRPVALTSLMLSAGFLVVALSGFATLRQWGLLSALTMGICVVADLVLLPAVLMRARV
jgi:hypothetical protein